MSVDRAARALLNQTHARHARHMDAPVTEHAVLHGQLLHHRPGKGRLGDTQLMPLSPGHIARRSPRPHVAPDLCNGLYCSPTIPVWFNRVGTPTHGILSLIVSPFLRWAQLHAVAAVPDDALRLDQTAVRCSFAYNTISIAFHLTFFFSQSSTTFVRYTHSFTVTPSATKSLEQLLRPSCPA